MISICSYFCGVLFNLRYVVQININKKWMILSGNSELYPIKVFFFDGDQSPLRFILKLYYFQTKKYQSMPFKVKLIRQFQKCFKSSQQSQSKGQKTSCLTQHEQSSLSKTKQKKKLIHRAYNLCQLALKNQILGGTVITNFFNIVAINEDAVRQNTSEDSYFKTLFYIKNIKKIEIKEKYLLITLGDAPNFFPPLEAMIERFFSFGDLNFFKLANLMTQAASRLRVIEQSDLRQVTQDSGDFIQKYCQTLSNKIYTFRTANNKIVISKALLELFQMDAEEFSIQSVKHRAPIYDPASSQRYFDVIIKYFENLRNLLDLVNDRISLEAFLDNSVIRFRDTFITKRNKKLFCKVKVGMPSPLVNIFQIEEVINRAQEYETFSFANKIKKRAIQDIKNNNYQFEIKTVRLLLKLPKNLFPENINKVVSYIPISSTLAQREGEI